VAVQGVDAVVSAYNAGWTNPQFQQDFLQASAAINEGVAASGVKRLLVVGGAGSLFVAPGVQLVDTPDFPAEWKAAALASRDALNRLREVQNLDWAFVSPAAHLEPGERTGVFRLGRDELVVDAQGHSRITVADLAVAIVDELERPQHLRQRFTAAY